MKKAVSTYIGALFLFSATCLADVGGSYDKALTAYNGGEIQEAYILLKNVLSNDPSHLPSKLLMGRILLIDGYVEDAITEFEEVLMAGGDQNLVLGPLARAYLFSGKYEDIFKMLQRRDLSGDTRLAVILVAGSAHIRMNNIDEAISLYEKNMEVYPQSVALMTNLATAYIENDQLDKAQPLLAEAEKREQNNPDVLMALGRLEAKSGAEEKSVQLYRRAYNIAPDNPTVMRFLAGGLALQGEYSEASKLVAEIEKQTPGDIQNRLLKARILALTENQLEADKILTELSEQISLLTDQQLNQQLELSLIAGVVSYINQNYGLASTELSRYLSEREATPELMGMLIDSLLKIGYYKDAVKVLEKNEALVVKHLNVASLACELYMALKRTFKCEQLLPAIEKNFPAEPGLQVLKAKLLLNKGKQQEALAVLNEHLASSEKEDVLQLKTVLLSKEKAFDEALSYARTLTEKSPENPAYQSLLAEVLFRLGRIDEASSIVVKQIKADAQYLPALILKARIEFAKDTPEAAAQTIEQVLKLDKNNLSALVLAGQIYITLDRFEQGIEHLLTAKTVNKDDARPRELLVSIYQQQQDYRSALGEVNQLINMDRLSPAYALEKADILMKLNRNAEAKTQLDIVYAHWAQLPQHLLKLSAYQVLANDFSGAEKSLNTAIEQAPDSAMPQLALAEFLLNQERLEEAGEIIAKAESKFGLTADALLIKGDLALAQQDASGAFDLYQQAHLANPNYPQPLIKLFELARQGTNRNKFIQHVKNTPAEEQVRNFSQHLLADMYYLEKQYTEAEQIYQRLLQQDSLPNRAFVLNNLANIYSSKDLAQAQKYIEQGLKLLPDSAPLLDTKGWLLALSGDYQPALDALRQSYTLNSTDPSLHYHLAYTLKKLGRTQEAKETLLKNATLQKDFPEKQEAQRLFDSL